jgi:hypothetical protein
LKKHTNFKASNVYFVLFVLFVGLQKSNYLILKLSGFDIQSYISVSLLVFPLIFLFMAYNYSPAKNLVYKKNRYNYLVNLVLIYVNFLFVYGFIRGNNVQIMLQEYWTSLFLLLSYKIAISKNIWSLFEGKLKVVFLIFTILVFLGRLYPRENLVSLGFSTLDISDNTSLLAYEMSPILDFWPFLFLLGFFSIKKPKFRLMTYIPFLIYLIFQLFFLKRAPTLRAISFLIFAVGLNMRRTKNSKVLFRGVFLFLFLGITIYLYTPEALIKRFEVKDTARQDEAKNMLSQLSPLDFIIGRGLGGEYYVKNDGVVESINEDGKPVNTKVHIGLTYPILKGGIFLFSLILYHIFLTVYNGLKNLNSLNNKELTCLVFLIIYSVFRIIEGPLTTGSIFDALLFGMSLGCLNKRQEVYYKYLRIQKN